MLTRRTTWSENLAGGTFNCWVLVGICDTKRVHTSNNHADEEDHRDERGTRPQATARRPHAGNARGNTRLETRVSENACTHLYMRRVYTLYMRRVYTLDMRRGPAHAYMKTRVCTTQAGRTCVHPHRSLALHLPIRDFTARGWVLIGQWKSDVFYRSPLVITFIVYTVMSINMYVI